ncbi:MAG: hypothetical protein Q8O42_00085 [Acidobacteriota bacterium]|nr:hypothetical protein [Acidobacteriota bacterium]
MRPDHDVPPGLSVGGVLWLVARHPWRYVARRWNYKSAAMSSLFRATVFFAVNLSAGFAAAVGAMVAEFWLRFATAGFYGALTQAFRRAEPERAATLTAMVLLPLVGHGLELALHWSRGTPRLMESILASVILTAFSTAFNLFAMRRGALIIGDGSRSLLQDLIHMPALFAAFILSWRSRPSI